MPTTIKVQDGYLVEESSGGIEVSFTDTDGSAATPDTPIKWTWMNSDGDVINNREEEEITADSTIVIPVSGDDLALPEGRTSPRVLCVEGTYDSAVLGDNVPFKDELTIYVKNLVRRPQTP